MILSWEYNGAPSNHPRNRSLDEFGVEFDVAEVALRDGGAEADGLAAGEVRRLRTGATGAVRILALAAP